MNHKEIIQTKLLFEIKNAKFLSLGFGNIAFSTADVVCVSAFNMSAGSRFNPYSAIGAIESRLTLTSEKYLLDLWPFEERVAGMCSKVEFGDYLNFGNLLIVAMGSVHDNQDTISTNIQMGLSNAINKLQSCGDNLQVDVVALGTRFGGVERQKSFDILSEWAINLFDKCPNISHVRLISYDIDTFVDFFVALHKIKNWSSSEMLFKPSIDLSVYKEFSKDVSTVLHQLEANPKNVIVTCRTIVETIVRKTCKKYSVKSPATLNDGIFSLKGIIPDYIHSYLQTCRVLGNFSAHDIEFTPSRRDAEGVILLTLRIIEWYIV